MARSCTSLCAAFGPFALRGTDSAVARPSKCGTDQTPRQMKCRALPSPGTLFLEHVGPRAQRRNATTVDSRLSAVGAWGTSSVDMSVTLPCDHVRAMAHPPCLLLSAAVLSAGRADGESPSRH